MPDIVKYRLSSAFITQDDSNEFEWTATVLNINKCHSEELQKMCKALYDYSEFIARIRQNMLKKNMDTQTISECVGLPVEKVQELKSQLESEKK